MLELKHITKDFDGLRAVNDVSFSVQEGQIVGLIGPNGSGKSTLLNTVSGIHPLTSGMVLFDGHDITNDPPDKVFERGIARGFQDPSLFFQMTVLDNTLLPVKKQRGEHPWFAPWRRFWINQERENASHADTVLKQVELRKHYDRASSDLSGGQMKLLDIGRCLMGNPRLMLLDEPTAGVAPKLAYDIFLQIEAMNKSQGITFLIIEHRLEILFDFVDYVYVLHMGSLLAEGTPEAIADNAQVREVYFGE